MSCACNACRACLLSQAAVQPAGEFRVLNSTTASVGVSAGVCYHISIDTTHTSMSAHLFAANCSTRFA
jgi:hypothetical protein